MVAKLGPLFYACWALYGLHFVWQARRLRLDDPQGALNLFKSNREAGLFLAIGFGLGLIRF